MYMAKQLLVSSQIQATLMNEFLIDQIRNGFWVGQRPANHGTAWEGVEAVVSETNQVGPIGEFKPMRYYDFLNPEFTKLHEQKLVELAQTVKPTMTFKALKKELIELARIIGGRMTDKTQEPARVYRGNNRADYSVIRVVDKKRVTTPAGAKAAVDRAATAVKKTVTKIKNKPSEDGVTVTKTASGATVRRVAVKTKTAVEQ
jgi:hypothetical protein